MRFFTFPRSSGGCLRALACTMTRWGSTFSFVFSALHQASATQRIIWWRCAVSFYGASCHLAMQKESVEQPSSRATVGPKSEKSHHLVEALWTGLQGGNGAVDFRRNHVHPIRHLQSFDNSSVYFHNISFWQSNGSQCRVTSPSAVPMNRRLKIFIHNVNIVVYMLDNVASGNNFNEEHCQFIMQTVERVNIGYSQRNATTEITAPIPKRCFS